MLNILLVALGGGLGAACRFGASLLVQGRADGWPVATFAINVAGSFLIGVLAGWLAGKGDEGEPWRLFIGVGLLGGFTTFSAYSLETLRLVERGDWVGAGSYAAGSVVAGLIFVTLGMMLARKVFG